MNMTFAQADPIKVQKRKVKQENLRENFQESVNTENKKKKGKDKWKRKDKRKQNQFLKGNFPYFFLFTFYD